MKTQGIKILVFLFIAINLSCSTETIKSNCTPSASITDQSSKEMDNATLSQLLKDINDLANSKPCGDSKTWKTAPIGEKACGGPANYIAYSTEIDTECFLKKVTHFTEQTKKFNKKYGIISDCMIMAEPKSVKCESGKPVLVF
jgi:hypothetical protein